MEQSEHFRPYLQDEEVKEEHHNDNYLAEPVPASFKGRLNLAEFAFLPKPRIKLEPQSSPCRSPQAESSATQNAISNRLPLKRSSSTQLSPSPSPRKKARPPTGYAPPSTYSHLPELRDVIVPNLITLFIGLNPGIQTAVQGHAYAHPSNRFWKLLHSSGCTTRLCHPSEDGDLPELFSLGNTNIVARPTRNGSELSKKELDDGVEILEEKIRKSRPESVCIVGKSIWESIWRVRKGKAIKKEEFKYGWQDDRERMGGFIVDEMTEWEGARVFVACSTSGLAAGLLPAQKEAIWRELGVWVEERRRERGELKFEDSDTAIS